MWKVWAKDRLPDRGEGSYPGVRDCEKMAQSMIRGPVGFEAMYKSGY